MRMRFWGKKRRRGALAPEDWPEDGWHFLPGSFSMTEKDVPQGYALYTFAPNMGEEGWETVRDVTPELLGRWCGERPVLMRLRARDERDAFPARFSALLRRIGRGADALCAAGALWVLTKGFCAADYWTAMELGASVPEYFVLPETVRGVHEAEECARAGRYEARLAPGFGPSAIDTAFDPRRVELTALTEAVRAACGAAGALWVQPEE